MQQKIVQNAKNNNWKARPNRSKVINFNMVNEIFTSETKSLEVNNEGNLEVFKVKSDIERKESDG